MLDIDLHYTDFVHVEPILRVAELLKDRGLRIRDAKNSPIRLDTDAVLLTQQTLISPEILDHRSRILVLERSDSSISWDRRTTQHPHVIRVFKQGVLRPPELNNACRGRYHSTRISASYRKPPTLVLDAHQLAKLVPLYNYAVYRRMEFWLNTPLPKWDERSFVLNFAGTIDYGPNTPEISEHRRTAISSIGQIPGEHSLHAGRRLSQAEYNAALLNSRICVSPWGLGEICHRDMEAMFAGCVLIKPDTSFVSTWPPLFENRISYVPCRPDFADLREQTERVLDCREEMKEMRERNRIMLHGAWSAEQLANRLYKLLMDAIRLREMADEARESSCQHDASLREFSLDALDISQEQSSSKNDDNLTILTRPSGDLEMPGQTTGDAVRPARFESYGDTRYESCPLCDSSATRAIWKIPFSRLDERLPIGNTHVQYLPTFGSRTIYEYSLCEACESIFLDPYRAARKEQYASASNPGALEKIQRSVDRTHSSWKSYLARYDCYLKPHMPASGVLVDAACGAGQYLLLAKEDDSRKFDRSIGLEVSGAAVEHLGTLGIEAYQCDLDADECLTFVEPGMADFVIFSEAFEHVVFPLKCMKHLVRMLKPGGRLFFSAQRLDESLPVRPGENHCLSPKAFNLLLERLDCVPVLTLKRPGKWIAILEKR